MAIRRFDNPFYDLWVTENLDSSAFVSMFSDVLVHDTEALFSTGNIVLKGRQGSGKSMLLTLLETDTRIAYSQHNVEYPVPSKQRCFISAGIHLTQQSASLVAARASDHPQEKRFQIVASNFADYLNALLCRDLLHNLRYLHNSQSRIDSLLREVKVNLGAEIEKRFIEKLNEQDSWRGVLSQDCASIDQIIQELDFRIRQHRLYANGSIDELPQSLIMTRSEAGIPIADLATSIRATGVIASEVLILLRIDQHEELFELERHSGLGNVFRRVINSALARRDPRIAYRIGTRHYAWESDLTCWGSGAPLEQERDYSVIDLDSILRRGEQVKGWKFPELAKDVLYRRLQFAGFGKVKDPMNVLFGKSLDPREKARRYAAGSKPILRYEPDWAPEWKQYLDSLWEQGNPLDAKFGEAWLRQNTQQKSRAWARRDNTVEFPWRSSEWWAKERNEIALLQIAGDRQQALIWSGEKQIIDLAGTNILAFMTICKSVWAAWQRRNPRDAAEVKDSLPEFSIDDQIIGITEASQIWFKKIQVGFEADRRVRLISALGSWFRQQMLRDKRMAYPGHNGISLTERDLYIKSDVIQLIKICRDHGDLIETVHTTRNKSQEHRLKWYLHPLLCPFFRIPHVRTKEPIYTSLVEIEKVYGQQLRSGPQVGDIADSEQVNQLGLPGL